MTIQDLLIAWGKGRSIHDAPNGYPSQTPTARLQAKCDIGIAPLPDDEQQRVDAAVSAMSLTKPTHYRVICFAYIDHKTDSIIGKKLRMSRSSAREASVAAEFYLEAKLD